MQVFMHGTLPTSSWSISTHTGDAFVLGQVVRSTTCTSRERDGHLETYRVIKIQACRSAFVYQTVGTEVSVIWLWPVHRNPFYTHLGRD